MRHFGRQGPHTQHRLSESGIAEEITQHIAADEAHEGADVENAVQVSDTTS